MAVQVTAAHTAEARAEAGREAGEGGVAAAAAAASLAPGGFLGLPAPFSEEGNRAERAGRGRGGGGSAQAGGCPDGLSCGRDRPFATWNPCGPRGIARGLRALHEAPGFLRPSGRSCGAPPYGYSQMPSLWSCPCRRPPTPPSPALHSQARGPAPASLSGHGPALLWAPSHCT